MPTLYNFDLDENCYRVRLLAALIGYHLDVVAVDMVPGKEHLSPAFLARNPRGALPILVDGDLTLSGAEAILAHIARSGDATGRWLPAGGDDFGRVMHWLFFAATALAPAVAARLGALFGGTDAAALDRERAAAREAFHIMDDQLAMQAARGLGWFAGAAPTVADVALFTSFALSRDFGIDHDEFPLLRGWLRRLRALPGFVVMPGIPDYH